jgi:hypothetical protein
VIPRKDPDNIRNALRLDWSNIRDPVLLHPLIRLIVTLSNVKSLTPVMELAETLLGVLPHLNKSYQPTNFVTSDRDLTLKICFVVVIK